MTAPLHSAPLHFRRRVRDRASAAVLLLSALLLQACSSSDDPPPPPPAPTAITYSTPAAVYETDVPATPNTPTVTGGAPTSWTSSSPLPTGLALDAGTGVISGTPTVVTANTTYTITGANAGGSAMTTVDIEVVALAAPSALSYSDNPASYTKDVPIAQNLPTVTGTVTSWTITAGLPAGLSFDTATGGISGTPTAAAANATFTVTALNPAGQVTEDVDIEVLDVMAAPLMYALSETDESVVGFQSDVVNGSERSTGITPLSVGSASKSLALSTNSMFLYVTDDSDNTVRGFGVDVPTGALTSIGAGVATVTDPEYQATHFNGTTLYVSSTSGDKIGKHTLVTTTGVVGAVTETTTNSTGPARMSVAEFDQDELYVLSPANDKIENYGIDFLGDISFGSDADTGNNPVDLVCVVTPAVVERVYVSCDGVVDQIDQFAASVTGSLSPLTPASVSAPLNSAPGPMVANPAGTRLYVATTNAPSILQFAIGNGTGLLSPLGSPSAATAGNPGALAMSSDGQTVYAAIPSLNEIQVFRVGVTGVLASVRRFRTRPGTSDLALLPVAQPLVFSSPHAYVAYSGDGTVGQLAVSLGMGAPSLSDLVPGNILAAAGTIDLAMHPDQDYLLSANSTANQLRDFTRDTGTGLLSTSSALTPSPISSLPLAVAIESSGSYGYSVNNAASTIVPWELFKDATDLVAGTFAATGTDSRAVATAPLADFVYVPSTGQTVVHGYSIAKATGELTALGSTFATEASPHELVFHPSGRFAYTANNSGSVSQYALDLNGDLTALSPVKEDSPAMTQPVAIAAHPNGRNLYLAYAGTNSVGRFTVDPATGLTTVDATTLPTSGIPSRVAIDASGGLLSVSVPSLNRIDLFLIALDGSLTAAGSASMNGSSPGKLVFAKAVQ